MSEVPSQSRLLTLVFTDLVGSVELKGRLGDQAAVERIARHHQHLRGLVEGCGGREIDCAGDGFFLTFETPSTAVDFALRLQLLHHAEPRRQ